MKNLELLGNFKKSKEKESMKNKVKEYCGKLFMIPILSKYKFSLNCGLANQISSRK